MGIGSWESAPGVDNRRVAAHKLVVPRVAAQVLGATVGRMLHRAEFQVVLLLEQQTQGRKQSTSWTKLAERRTRFSTCRNWCICHLTCSHIHYSESRKALLAKEGKT